MMKQQITLPSIASILNNEDDDDNFNSSHKMKLPALSNHHYKLDKHYGTFLPTSPVSLSSLSPIQQYDNNNPSFITTMPPSPRIPLTTNSNSTSPLPHNIKEASVTENSDSPPLSHPSLFPIIFAPPLNFPPPYNKFDDKANKPCTKNAPAQQLQIIQSSARDGTIKKQRRGRPPVYTEYHCQHKGLGTADNQQWAFQPPIMWDIQLSSSKPATTLTPSCAMSTFSSITLEPESPPPRKKRGRNPKQYIEGNSCFLWKEIPIVRKKKIRPLLGQK